MSIDRQWLQILPQPLRRLPADLAGVLVLVGLTLIAVFVPGINQTPLRVIVGLPFVLFVPGYALVAALFPEAGEGPAQTDDEAASDTGTADGGIDGIERVALSFGVSIAVVPLVGLVLNFTPFGIRLVPIMVSLSALTGGLVAVAARRRWALPVDEQFRVPYRQWGTELRTELLEPDTRGDAALNVILAISVLLAVSSVGYAVAVPKQGESFTEFYLLTEDDDGELVAADYPTEFVAGQPESIVVGVENNEHETVNYSVVVAIQQVDIANNTTTVQRQQRLRTFQTELGDNETWRLQHQVAPELTGEELRLIYLLYRGEPPASPSADSAYRELHLFVNVSAPSSEQANTTAQIDRTSQTPDRERVVTPGDGQGQKPSVPLATTSREFDTHVSYSDIHHRHSLSSRSSVGG